MAACSSRSWSSSSATASPALSPNRRKSVPLPTPAAAATWSIDTAATPCSRNSRAAAVEHASPVPRGVGPLFRRADGITGLRSAVVAHVNPDYSPLGGDMTELISRDGPAAAHRSGHGDGGRRPGRRVLGAAAPAGRDPPGGGGRAHAGGGPAPGPRRGDRDVLLEPGVPEQPQVAARWRASGTRTSASTAKASRTGWPPASRWSRRAARDELTTAGGRPPVGRPLPSWSSALRHARTTRSRGAVAHRKASPGAHLIVAS